MFWSLPVNANGGDDSFIQLVRLTNRPGLRAQMRRINGCLHVNAYENFACFGQYCSCNCLTRWKARRRKGNNRIYECLVNHVWLTA